MMLPLLKRSAFYFIGLSVAKLLSVAVFILFARILLPESFGDLILYATLGQIVTFFGDFGLNQWYQKKAHLENREKVFTELINARIVTLACTLIITGVFFRIIPTFPSVIILFFLTTMIPDALLSTVDGYFFERKESPRVALKTVSRMVIFLAGYFLFKDSMTFQKVVEIYLAGSIITLAWFFPWKMLKEFYFVSLPKIFFILRASFPYAFLTLTSFAYARGDSLVVRYMLGSGALGLYGAAYRFLEGLSLIPTALSHNLFPLSAQESHVTLHQVKKIAGIMTLSGILVSFLLFITSPYLILFLLGNAYIAAIPLLRIFSLVVVLFFISSSLNTIVMSSRLVHTFVPWGAGNTILNIFLNILFIPVYGIAAAAWVMVVTEITGLLINLYFVRKVYK